MIKTISVQLGTQYNKDLPLGGPGSGHYGHAGRPGQRGGSLPADVAVSIKGGRYVNERREAAVAASKGVEAARKRAYKELHDIQGGNERAIVLDLNGNEVLRVDGEARRVEFTEAEAAKIKDTIFLHNHPSGWHAGPNDIEAYGLCFSGQDLVLMMHEDAAEGVVVSRKTLYRMIRPQQGWEKTDRKTIIDGVNYLSQEVSSKLFPKVSSGALTAREASFTHFIELAKRFADFTGATFIGEPYPGKYALTEVAIPLGGPGSGHYGHAGRPGLRGGSLPADVAVSIEKGRTAKERQKVARSGKRDARLIDALKDGARKLYARHKAGEKTEGLMVYSQSGDLIFQKTGTKHKVSFTDSDSEKSLDGIMIHSHPSGWERESAGKGSVGSSFSLSDVLLAQQTGMKEIVAVGKTYVYSLVRPEESGWPPLRFLRKSLKGYGYESWKELAGQIEAGKLTEYEAEALHNHEAIKLLANHFSMLYTRVPYEEYIGSLNLNEVAIPLGGPGSGHWGHAGRPGQRGGSLPADVAVSIEKGSTAEWRQRQAVYTKRDPGLEDALRDAAVTAHDYHDKGASDEFGVCLTQSGETEYTAFGDKDSIPLSSYERSTLRDGVFFHTHPSGWANLTGESHSLSKGDVMLAGICDAKEMIAMGPKYIYSLVRPMGGWPDRATLSTYVHLADSEIRGRYDPLVMSGELTVDDANKTFEHDLWGVFSILTGAIYRRIPYVDYINPDKAMSEAIPLGGEGSGHWGHAGRPGKRGGSLPGDVAVSIEKGRTAEKRQAAAKPVVHTKLLAEALGEAERGFWMYHDGGGENERSFSFTKSGKPVFGKEGHEASISFTDEQVAQMKDAILTHSHPYGWKFPEDHAYAAGNSFSYDDLRFARKADLAEMRAVSRGYTYRIVRPASGWPTKDIANKAIEAASDEAYSLAANEMRWGDLGDDSDVFYYHQFSKLYAEAIGSKYERIEHGY